MRYKIITRNGGTVRFEEAVGGGMIAYDEHGIQLSSKDISILYYPTASNDFHYDELGGFHDCGAGTSPDGQDCGECSNLSCKFCNVWRRPQ